MTRPRKQTVDYFPHDCNHGETLFVLEQRYGNDGYAFWFKLLELIGKTEKHYLDCNKKATWEFLLSRAHTNAETGLEMMNLLADLEAIDPELWENKIVWVEKFVKRVTDAYRNRLSEIPIRPDNLRKKPEPTPQCDAENPQTKLKESKLKERKDTAPSGMPSGASIMFFTCQFFDVDFDYRLKLAKDFPALTDALLKNEFSKMEDWIVDNKRKKKFKSNGHLGNPRLFIHNWLKKVVVQGADIFGQATHEPKSYSGIRAWARKQEDL